MQVMRAASLIYIREADSPRREELVRYFEARPANVWRSMGLFLLGKLTPEQLDQQTRGTNLSMASRGWLLGMRAAEQGRYEEASDWFEIAVESDQNREPPNAWAYETMGRWMSKGSRSPSSSATGRCSHGCGTRSRWKCGRVLDRLERSSRGVTSSATTRSSRSSTRRRRTRARGSQRQDLKA